MRQLVRLIVLLLSSFFCLSVAATPGRRRSFSCEVSPQKFSLVYGELGSATNPLVCDSYAELVAAVYQKSFSGFAFMKKDKKVVLASRYVEGGQFIMTPYRYELKHVVP